MAKNSKDPYTYEKERDGFLKELRQFHQTRGSPFSRVPKIGTKEVDLYKLYNRVTSLGGWEKVNQELLWEDFMAEFGIPYACTNAAQALKQIYLRYLSIFEKHHFGDQNEHEGFGGDVETAMGSHRRHKATLSTVPMRYNYTQHNVPDAIRESLGLSMDLVEEHEYKKLEKALLSGLPNEVDFAINVCTLLSNDSRRLLRLKQCPVFLQLFMAHVGIFGDGPGSFSTLYEEGWKPLTDRNFIRFWLDSVESDKDIQGLISPHSLYIDKGEITADEEGGEGAETETQGSLDHLLNTGRSLGVHDVEGQRILQLAMIVRNLSFDEDNMEVLASDLLVFRFLLLCIHCKYSCLKQLALDTMGNIAARMVLDPIDYRTTQLMLRTVMRSICAQDRIQVVRGLEILSRLCQAEENVTTIIENIEEKTYEDIVSYLTVHDIQLIVFTLEALLQLSELGEVTSDHIAEVKACIDTLVNLVTVEAQSYGPNSLMGIKVVEHVPAGMVPGGQIPPQIPRQMAPPQQHIQRPLVPPTPPQHQHMRPMAITAQSPRPVATPPPQPHPAPEMDSESTACNWLQAHYEPGVGVMTRMELYQEYLRACSRHGIRNVVNNTSFANCVRVTFPKVDSTRLERADGSNEVHYKGLDRRQQPLPFPPHRAVQRAVSTTPQRALNSGSPRPGPSMLHHQLTSPSKPGGSQPQEVPHSPNHYPTIQQALKGGEGSQPQVAPDSNLIKSLLAKKLVQNMQSQQLQQNATTQVQTGTGEAGGAPVPSVPGLPQAVPAQYVGPPGKPALPLPPHMCHPLPARAIQHLLQQQQQQQQQQHKAAATSTPDSASSTPAPPTNPPANLEVCSQAQVAANVVRTDQQRHLAKIERIDNNVKSSAEEARIEKVVNPCINALTEEICRQEGMEPQGIVAEEVTKLGVKANKVLAEVTSNATAVSKSDRGNVIQKENSKVQGPIDSNNAHINVPNKPHEGGTIIDSCVNQPNVTVQIESDTNGKSDASVSRTQNNGTSNGHVGLEKTKVNGGESHVGGAVSVNKLGSPPLVNGDVSETPGEGIRGKDKLLTLEEIEKEKKRVAQELLTGHKSGKDAPLLNGLLHPKLPMGNGDCVVGFAKTTTEVLSRDNHKGDGERTGKEVDSSLKHKTREIQENGYNAPSPMHIDSLHDKANRIAGGDLTSNTQTPAQQSSLEHKPQIGGPLPQATNCVAKDSSCDTSQQAMEVDAHLSKQGPVYTVQSQALQQTSRQQVVLSGGSVQVAAPSGMPAPLLASQAAPSLPASQLSASLPGQPSVGAVTIAELLRKKAERNIAASQKQQQTPPLARAALPTGEVVTSMPSPAQLQDQLTAATQLQTQVAPVVLPSRTSTPQHQGHSPANPALMSQLQARLQGPTRLPASPQVAVRPPQIHIIPVSGTSAIAAALASPTGVPMSHTPTLVSQAKLPPPTTPSVTNVVSAGASMQKRPSTTPAEDKQAKKVKRSNSRSNSIESRRSSTQSQGAGDFVCEWAGCKKCFETSKAVRSHVVTTHYGADLNSGYCQWETCDGLHRMRYSLMSHIQDRHLTEAALKAAVLRRQQLIVAGGGPPPVAAAPAVPPPVYPADAALQAIRRYAIRPPFPELMEMKEGPVTKHIRLTSALILRNIAKYSPLGRMLIRRHEQQLAYVAMSAVESSTAVATCLWELNNIHTQQH